MFIQAQRSGLDFGLWSRERTSSWCPSFAHWFPLLYVYILYRRNIGKRQPNYICSVLLTMFMLQLKITINIFLLGLLLLYFYIILKWYRLQASDGHVPSRGTFVSNHKSQILFSQILLLEAFVPKHAHLLSLSLGKVPEARETSRETETQKFK